jgi:hypothetical protein
LDIPLETLAFWWDNAWEDAPEGASTFYEQLRAEERKVGELFSQGALASVGKNSASQAYRGPGVGSFTPAQIQAGFRWLINLYKRVQLELTNEVATNDPQAPVGGASEANIYARGYIVLANPITEYQSDITDLLLPPTLSAPQPVNLP